MPRRNELHPFGHVEGRLAAAMSVVRIVSNAAGTDPLLVHLSLKAAQDCHEAQMSMPRGIAGSQNFPCF